MTHEVTSTRDFRFFLVIGLGLTFFALWLVSLRDLVWSQQLASYGQQPWVRWMDQSFFEGDALGASDLPLILYGLVLIGYLTTLGARGRRRGPKRLGVLLGRVLLTGLGVGLATHGLKGGMDRPRPKDVLGAACLYQEWFERGHVCGGQYQGKSFPSGHTATAASLWAMNAAWLAWLNGSRRNSTYRKIFGVGGAVLVMFFALAMGVARVMHGDHWLTDVLASIFLGAWVVVVFWRKELMWGSL